MKKTLPDLSSPCGLFAVFEGEPLASEHCAKWLDSTALIFFFPIDLHGVEMKLQTDTL